MKPITSIASVKWDPETSRITDAIASVIKDKGAWEQRWEVASYVDRCIAAGFCKTGDDMRQCTERFLAGKRVVTPPGTARRKKQAKERKALMANLPKALVDGVASVIQNNEKAVSQYKAGNEKAINALVGQVMRIHKTDASVIRDLLIAAIQ